MTTNLYWAPIDEPGQLRDARLQRLFVLWTEATASGKPPPKKFIDPGKFGDLMEWLFVYRVERNPLRFFYLVSSQKLVRRFGFDMTGKYVDEHPDPVARKGILANFTAVVTTGKPHGRLSVRRLFGHDMTTEALVLPLAGPDGTIDHLLALQILDMPGGFGP
ncbi:MAG: PAS domain-containing protein [Rhodospirillaceae bacterium]|nr:PAS domain-containing protein [Rhodospirillaceae bacterium]